jgi:hypothetical protein
MTRLSESKTQSVVAIGNIRVIPAAFSPRESGEGIQRLYLERTTLGSRFRGNDDR